MAKTKVGINVSQVTRGKDGRRYIFRDVGQRLSIRDQQPLQLNNWSRSSADHAAYCQRMMKQALSELHEGRFVQGDMLVRLCKKHGVKISKNVLFQLKYMNELDVSVRTIRHRNTRGDFQRRSFHGIFSVVEYLIAQTLDA